MGITQAIFESFFPWHGRGVDRDQLALIHANTLPEIASTRKHAKIRYGTAAVLLVRF